MRSRIVTSPNLGVPGYLERFSLNNYETPIEGLGSAQYLWERKQVGPFLKVDKGLAGKQRGQLMKPMPDLDALLEEAGKNFVFGTKMRSVSRFQS
ncbi:MAG: hypothetical protein Ct9H90mP8_2840 [Pseudomonadota bacterium]|nr:MAG: hypothetical protein Ct9H90mP8_2840 [Pseudomonadota bacterium]